METGLILYITYTKNTFAENLNLQNSYTDTRSNINQSSCHSGSKKLNNYRYNLKINTMPLL